MTPKPKGIRKTPRGWQAFVYVNNRFYSKRYPPETSLTTMKRWRESKRVRVREGRDLPAPDSTLAADVRHYLEQVRTMPTVSERQQHLQEWIHLFGPERDRKTITAGEIRAQLETLRADDYAPSSVNHRRTALMHLFSVLDGKSAPNPAKDVPRYREPRRAPRALAPAVIRALLAAMPRSSTRARLELMAWTGWPHAQIRRLEPSDIRWKDAVYIRPRQKGAGVEGRWLPLLPQAWQALRQFKQAGAWGTFSTSSMRKALRSAATRLRGNRRIPKAIREAVADITPYDFRHSFGTLVALASRDDTAVQTVMLHSDPRQSRRYTEAAVDPRVVAALSKLSKALPRLMRARKRSGKAA